MDISITVIAAFYNCETYAKKCVSSILTQSYPISEIILVNDGSEDGTGDVLEQIRLEHNNIIKVIASGHQGVSTARNMGIEFARYNDKSKI